MGFCLYLLVVAIAIVIVGRLLHKKAKWGFFFIIQALLLTITVISSIRFFAGCDVIPRCEFISRVLEKGSFEAIGSAAGTIGIGNFLFVWIYGERDKLILGIRQHEIIARIFQNGYAGSVIIHFAATVLCLFLAKSGARESSVWAFLTLIWGCCIQAYICKEVAFNKTRREEKAISIWDGEYQKNSFETIKEMASCFGDSEIYNNRSFRNAFCKHLAEWISGFSPSADEPEVRKNIERIATVFRRISMKAADGSYDSHVLSDFFVSVVSNISSNDILKKCQKEADTELFCYGIVYYFWGLDTNYEEQFDEERTTFVLSKQIHEMVYYSQTDTSVSYAVSFLWAAVAAIEWYLFLDQKISIMPYTPWRLLSEEPKLKKGLVTLLDLLFQASQSVNKDEEESDDTDETKVVNIVKKMIIEGENRNDGADSAIP